MPRRRNGGFRSSLEAAFAKHLDYLKASGAVVSWKYEPKPWLRLYTPAKGERRKRRTYCPDFEVDMKSGETVMFEVKAHHRWYEKGVLKLAWAADKFPEKTFRLMERIKGKWMESAY